MQKKASRKPIDISYVVENIENCADHDHAFNSVQEDRVEDSNGDFLRGDSKRAYVAHIVNNKCVIGAGVSGSIIKKWKGCEKHYLEQCRYCTRQNEDMLGRVVLSFTYDEYVKGANYAIKIVHMFGQRGLIGRHNSRPIDYQALQKCLDTLCMHSIKNDSAVIMPKIGSGLAGGSWELIEQMIKSSLCDRGVKVTIFTGKEKWR